MSGCRPKSHNPAALPPHREAARQRTGSGGTADGRPPFAASVASSVRMHRL